MMALINYRLRITLNDGRQMTGQMLAFDQHMNLVMADSESNYHDPIGLLLIVILCSLSGRISKTEVKIKEA